MRRELQYRMPIHSSPRRWNFTPPKSVRWRGRRVIWHADQAGLRKAALLRQEKIKKEIRSYQVGVYSCWVLIIICFACLGAVMLGPWLW